MPLGYFGASAPSAYPFLSGPYSNHSSIIAASYTRPPASISKPLPRFRGFTPHLATITESRGISRPLARINSPKLIIHTTPTFKMPKPISINTADIDVSVNKYKRYDRKPRSPKISEIPDKHRDSKSPSPIPATSTNSVTPNEEQPSAQAPIRRDRVVVRLHTIRRKEKPKAKNLNNEITRPENNLLKGGRKWRQSFHPDELKIEEKKEIKTPGEKLKEKHLIRDKAEEERIRLNNERQIREHTYEECSGNVAKEEEENIGIPTTFQDICRSISSDTINDNLNPGQSDEIKRKQSRQFSTDDILKQIRRNSAEILQENVILLDKLLREEKLDVQPEDEHQMLFAKQATTVPNDKFHITHNDHDGRASVKRKKPVTKTKSNVILNDKNKEILSTKLQRRATLKKVHRTCSDRILTNDSKNSIEIEQPCHESVKDISQVEIEEIKIKPKPIITATVNVESTKSNLKFVVNDISVEEKESSLRKPVNKFKLNFTVGSIKEHRKSIERDQQKVEPICKTAEIERPTQEEPKTIEQNSIESLCDSKVHVEKKLPNVKLELSKSKLLEDCQGVVHIPKSKNAIITNPILKNCSAHIVKILDNDLKEIEQQKDIKQKLPKRLGKIKKKETACPQIEKIGICKKEFSHPNKDENSPEINFWDAMDTRGSFYVCNRKQLVEHPSFAGRQNLLPNSETTSTLSNGINERLEENDVFPDTLENGKLTSKRSLIQKPSAPDPDLHVFAVPEEPEKSHAPLTNTKEEFVPLQSNRISKWMHPFQKPEHLDECPVEIYATPKVIRKRHYPRGRHVRLQTPNPHPPPIPTPAKSSSDSDSSDSESDNFSNASESSGDATNEKGAKVGASTSSNDSGFLSSAPGSPLNRRHNKDCDVNCHKKCEKLTANLCGVNQKLIVEAIASVRKGSSENRDSPSTSNPACNPAFALDAQDSVEDDLLESSTYTCYQRSGRITPPATTIPRFRKYTIEDFHFLKVLGKGSFGKVLLAELKNTEYYYAVKCLKKDVVLEDDDVECTLIERKVLALGTKHPFLCHLLCTFQTDSHLFFVMEYLNGGDLMFHIQYSGRFPEPHARFYAAEITSGLKFLHSKGIVYRDLKLDNILLDYDGHVRIADFGMCKLQIFLDRTADTFCGTPDYMAPEIIKGQHYNQCVDWWSFGVLLYEMLIGQSPFSGCDEDELFWSICNEKPVFPRFFSTEASSILALLLEKDASKRLGNKLCPAGDIKHQSFFQQIAWDRLEARQLEPPFKPNLQHPLDTQYFDKAFTVEKAKLTPIEKNILHSMDQSQFQGFSYTNPNATDK